MADNLARYIDQTLDHYLRTRSANSANTYKSHAKILTEAFGDLQPEELTTRMVTEWAGQEVRQFAPATITHRLNFLSHVFDLLEELGFNVPNPVKKARKPRIRNGRTRWITEAEEARLLAALEPEDRAMVRFTILTGLRRLEVFSLKAENVDQAGRLIQFLGSKGTRLRAVPLTDEALAILQKQIADRPEGAYLFGSQGERRVAEGNRFASRLRIATRNAGLKEVTCHIFRHTFASRLAQRGTSLLVVQALLGHVDPKQTLRYSHLQAENLRDAVNALTPALPRVVPPPDPPEAAPPAKAPVPPVAPKPGPGTVTFFYLPGRGW